MSKMTAEQALADFLANLQRSRTKYPMNARMFDGLMGEVDELRRAYHGDGDVRAEAFDVAVCAFRIATEGDAGGNVLLDLALTAPRVPDVDALAQIIREVDGNNSLGAGALAEAIISRIKGDRQ